jgi:uncharacterized protein
MEITKKRALITGASSGIGLECARLFAKQHCNLLLLARNGDALEKLAEELVDQYGVNVDILVEDVCETKQLQEHLLTYIDQKPIQIAIINHGVGQFGRFVHTSWDQIEPVLNTNITGAAAIAHSVLPSMVEAEEGSVVFISSILGKRSVANNAAYCASKFALHGLADALRLEVRPHGVHIGIVAPSRTETGFRDRMMVSEEPGKPVVSQVSDHPSVVAKHVLRCIRKRKREIVVSVWGKLFSYIGYHFPRSSDMILARAVPKPSPIKE